MAESFGLHPLAVEDAVKAHQRPKLERYDDSLFLALKTLWYVDEDDAVETGEINIFAGHDFVVTVRHGRGSELHSARARLESDSAVLTHGPSAVVYAVCDTVVDGYTEVVDELAGRRRRDRGVGLLAGPHQRLDADLHPQARDRRGTPRRAAAARADAQVLRGPGARAWSARPRRSSATCSTTSTRPPRWSTTSTRCCRPPSTPTWRGSRSSRTTTCARSRPGVALVVVPTLIAGVYGMNFDHMPELGWELGYPFALLLMVVASGGLCGSCSRSPAGCRPRSALRSG